MGDGAAAMYRNVGTDSRGGRCILPTIRTAGLGCTPPQWLRAAAAGQGQGNRLVRLDKVLRIEIFFSFSLDNVRRW